MIHFRRIKQCKCTVTFQGFPFNTKMLHEVRVEFYIPLDFQNPEDLLEPGFWGKPPVIPPCVSGGLPQLPSTETKEVFPTLLPRRRLGIWPLGGTRWSWKPVVDGCGPEDVIRKWYKKWYHPQKIHMLTLKNREAFSGEGWNWNDLLVLNVLLHSKN